MVCGNGILVRSPLHAFPERARADRPRLVRTGGARPTAAGIHHPEPTQYGGDSPMKRFKTFAIRSITAGVAALALAGAAHAQTVKVLSIVDHPALDAIRDGVRAELKAEGYGDDKLKWEYQSAQGNTGTAAQIARKFVGDKPDVIVAIATPAAQSVVAATKSVPVVYSGVTDPVAAQLVKGWGPSGTNVTGVSDKLPLDRQVALIKRVVPNAKTVGMVYNPGEANSVVVVKELKEILAKQGMTLKEAAAPRTVDIGPAAKSLIGKVDVIYTNTDNNVVSAYEALVKVANEAKIPLVAGDTDSVKRGGIAALGINYGDLGRQTGKVVARILKGEKPGAIASETSSNLELFVNTGAAAKQGVTLSPDLVKEAKTVIK
ncbi:oligopeptide ABC transporter, oligopeptide-binding protein [Burkholderia cenocepacia BC7]|nr:oligopeptide ABC transporter, oligopeptide-binding protein [Burkholderia cenocepacia K56-2Valvano]ERI26302.1 oligopeptide ABC transporter, oligopeptide-binding protein [Burkholderia cenocepacia BC7]